MTAERAYRPYIADGVYTRGTRPAIQCAIGVEFIVRFMYRSICDIDTGNTREDGSEIFRDMFFKHIRKG